MDELTRGLSLLGPKLEQLTRQIDQLGTQVTELRAEVAKKADTIDAQRLKSQIESLCGNVVESQKQGVQREQFNQLRSSLEEVCSIVAAKAEAIKMEQLDDRLKAITEAIDKKAEASRLEQLAQELRASGSSSPPAMEAEEPSKGVVTSELASLKDLIGAELKAMKEAVDGRAEAARLSEIAAAVGSHTVALAGKADGAIVDQLNERFRSMTASLAQKAEFTEVKQLKAQVDALRDGADKRAETDRAELKRAGQQLHEALSSAVGSQETEKKLCDLEKLVQRLDTAVEHKADGEKVESLASQLKVLSDVLSPKIRAASPRPRSARVRRPEPRPKPASPAH